MNMLTPSVVYYQFEDYLAIERELVDAKNEYLAGEAFAMSGGSYEHSVITANLTSSLANQFKGSPCAVLTSDMRIRVAASDACFYPDLSVLCGQPIFHDARRDVLTNPLLIAEVLSPSTESYDRGSKFAHYRRLPSLRHYLLIAQDRLAVDVFTRQPDDRWLLASYETPHAVIALHEPDCQLPMQEIYDRIVF